MDQLPRGAILLGLLGMRLNGGQFALVIGNAGFVIRDIRGVLGGFRLAVGVLALQLRDLGTLPGIRLTAAPLSGYGKEFILCQNLSENGKTAHGNPGC